MSRKIMKIPSILKKPKQQLQQWQRSCKHPKTLSFRARSDDVYKTLNSVFLDHPDHESVRTPDSWFTTTSSSSECTSNNSSSSAAAAAAAADDDPLSVETIIRGVKSSDRLFFEPERTSSILCKEEEEEAASGDVLPFKESVALALESEDPYSDFKRSMQEMVESHGLKDWECLEELLGWYLRMNRKMNHGIIVGAFVDLLVGAADNQLKNTSSDLTSYSSADSCFSSPDQDHGDDEDQLGLRIIDDDHVGAAGDVVVH